MFFQTFIPIYFLSGLEVLFIDYGNSYTCNSVRELPEDLLILAPLAIKCSLEKPPGVLQWSPKTSEKFKEISKDGAAEFKVRKITPGETSVVQLLLNGVNVSDQLLPETESGCISYFESVDSFWIQKSESSDVITIMGDAMVEAGNWPVKDPVHVGDLVAAMSDEDQFWYRAKILSVKDKEYEVLFVDYGNSAVVTEVRQISEDIANEPFLAIQCSLDMLPGHRWSEDVSKNLEAINSNGKLSIVRVSYSFT